jgi:hypothetical protein
MTARLLRDGSSQEITREGRLTCPLQYVGSQEGLNGSKVLKPFLLFFVLLSYLKKPNDKRIYVLNLK